MEQVRQKQSRGTRADDADLCPNFRHAR
jgi:hypothetical protein